MTIGCNIWMICSILIWIFYGLSRMFQVPQFVWALRSSVWDVFINFLLIDATDKSKINSDQKCFFISLSLYPLSFFANTPFKKELFNKYSFELSRKIYKKVNLNKRTITINNNTGDETSGLRPVHLWWIKLQVQIVNNEKNLNFYKFFLSDQVKH